jgi:diguanylate cyclase (GGDEF)-like protein
MRPSRVLTFAQKMTLMALLASSMAVGTLMTAFLVFDTISSRSLLHSCLSSLADVVGQNATAALNFNDHTAAVEVLEGLRAEPPIDAACLYDVPGELFAHYERQEGPWKCPLDLKRVPAIDRKYFSVTRPVLRHNELVGTLFLSSNLQEVHKRQKLLLRVASFLLLLALVVGGVSASLLQRKISKPVSELVHAMHKVTVEQNFDTRVAVLGRDEIAQLGIGFNAMLSELQRREDAKKNAEAKLQFQALNDVLTGLPNRRLFSDRLSQVLALARREQRMVALLYIDLDGFKLVNDSLGHSLGDELLVQVAARWQLRVRQADTLARLGGDEFTVILGGLHAKEDAAAVAKSLLDVLATPFLIDDHQLTIGASIGISLFPEDGSDADELLQHADSAMYAAKRDGKNRAMYFTPEIGTLVRERMNLENQLRAALARAEIKLYYQPEFDILSNRLVRFEAVGRWTHPTLGVISPAKFIPVAEESGLIVPLCAYSMELACAEAVKWQALAPYPIQVAVNISSMQFRRDQFVAEVVEVLNHTGLKPELLQLELTESIMLSGIHRAVETMKRLKELGVSLAIDDFGTGYSCLSYLRSLPFDALKIDRSFIQELGLKPKSEAMVRSLITLAKSIGMRVIVEGVETPEQLELIKTFGADDVQGYLTGRPAPDPAAQISLFLQNRAGAPRQESDLRV